MKWIARLGEREEAVEIRRVRSAERVGEGSCAPPVADQPPPAPVGGQGPAPTAGSGHAITVRVGDQVLELDLGAGLAPSPGATGGGMATTREASVIHAGRQQEVAVERLSKIRYAVSIDGRGYEVTVDDQLGFLTREAAGARAGVGGTTTAYMPGKVATVLVEEGAEVKAGEGVVVLEAMKMENEIQADIDGVVSKIYVEAGQAVEGGDALFEVVVNE